MFEEIPNVVGKIIKYLANHQRIDLLVNTNKSMDEARKQLKSTGCKLSNIKFHKIKTDRLWLRDSGPIFLINKKTRKKIINYQISKYLNIKSILPKRINSKKFEKVVMEGGAFDTNGSGSILLTKECLLSSKQERNKGFKKSDYESLFSKYLNTKNFIWLNKGIVGDDTHGHIDDIARFVSKTTIMIADENNKSDKNYKSLKENIKILRKSYDENGRKFKIIKIPMPSPIFIQKTRVPASYLNFFISNKAVLVPIFNVKEDKKVLRIFRKFFTKRKVIAVDCSDLIWGFGAIHCMTQQEPII
jgi:agmatine deiminase